MYKHHRWDELLTEFRLEHEFNTGPLTDPFDKRAKFQTPSSVRLFNNFEEHAADGKFHFRDPWYVENNQQNDVLEEKTSPHIPTGNADDDRPAAFLRQSITSGNPYYSAKYETFYEEDRSTTATTPLLRGYWSLIDVFAREATDAVIQKSSPVWNFVNGRWRRATELNVDMKFLNAGTDVFGFYKAHLQATHEAPPTQGNSQMFGWSIRRRRWSQAMPS